jgi:hypothetical protein
MVALFALGSVITTTQVGKAAKPLTAGVAAGAIGIRIALIVWALAVLS